MLNKPKTKPWGKVKYFFLGDCCMIKAMHLIKMVVLMSIF